MPTVPESSSLRYFSGGVFDPTMPETLAESDIDNVDSTIVSGQSISVKYLEMDSPYFNGITDPAVPMTTDEIAKTVSTFMADIDAYYEKKSEVPPLIGDEDPYPTTPSPGRSGMDVPTLEAYFNDLIALGTRPAFYHMDINYTYLMKDDGGLTSYAKLTQFNNDMKTLSQFFAKNGIGFGTIIEAGRADNDRTYAQTVLQDVGIINTALGGPRRRCRLNRTPEAGRGSFLSTCPTASPTLSRG